MRWVHCNVDCLVVLDSNLVDHRRVFCCTHEQFLAFEVEVTNNEVCVFKIVLSLVLINSLQPSSFSTLR